MNKSKADSPEIKKLRFADPLPELIISGQKTVTWRMNDEKNIMAGDFLSLCRSDGSEFAKAKVVSAKEVVFKEMTADDKTGHEHYDSDDEIYEVFSQYYHIKAGPDTPVKIIAFELLAQH